MSLRTAASISRGVRPSGISLRVSRGRSSAAEGQSHSCVTATTSSPRPSAKSASVADGTRLATRKVSNALPYGNARSRCGSCVKNMVGPMDKLDDSEIESRLADLEGWERAGDCISKEFERNDF